jgi:hypothetical protein
VKSVAKVFIFVSFCAIEIIILEKQGEVRHTSNGTNMLEKYFKPPTCQKTSVEY